MRDLASRIYVNAVRLIVLANENKAVSAEGVEICDCGRIGAVGRRVGSKRPAHALIVADLIASDRHQPSFWRWYPGARLAARPEYSAPHLSARGTLTLLNNALLSAHFRIADHPARDFWGGATEVEIASTELTSNPKRLGRRLSPKRGSVQEHDATNGFRLASLRAMPQQSNTP